LRSSTVTLTGADEEVLAATNPDQRRLVDRVIDGMNPVAPRSTGVASDNQAALPRKRIAAVGAPTRVFRATGDTLPLHHNTEFAAATPPASARAASKEAEAGSRLLPQRALLPDDRRPRAEATVSKTYDEITPELEAWMSAQHMFFVATAPLSADGHVNCSPKGLDSFRVLDARTVAYLDLTGSGAETISHLRENARIVFMFCEMSGTPKIVRLHGRGRIVRPDTDEWRGLIHRFPPHPGARTIVAADVTRVSDSCGFGVPKYDFVRARRGLTTWAESKGAGGLAEYRTEKNATSIDGLPALSGGAAG